MFIYYIYIYQCQYVTDQWTSTRNEVYPLVQLFNQFFKKFKLYINTAGLHENSAIRGKAKSFLSFLCCTGRNVVYATINL